MERRIKGDAIKRGTPDHPKTALMAFGLSIPRYAAVGLLEMLWHFTATYAPAGDIGRWTDEQIAERLAWTGDAGKLIKTMTDAGWLDTNEECRLYVHDWHDHADDSMQRQLARAHKRFANGSAPNWSRLDKEERETAKVFYSKPVRKPRKVRPACARRAPEVRPAVPSRAVAVAVPSPALPPPPPDAPAFGSQLSDRDELCREGYRLAGEEAVARGLDIRETLREASTVPKTGWYLVALEGAKPEHLLRTVNRLRDNAKARRAKQPAPEVPEDVSAAPELAVEFLAWHRDQPEAGETQGQAIVRWWKSKGIEFGKPLAVAISQHVRSLLAQPREATA